MSQRQISLVTLIVPDYEAGLDFYVRKLGFVLLEDADLGGGKRWVRVAPKGGETALLLAKAANSAQKTAIGSQSGGRVSFFLTTDDFDADYAAMRAQGVFFLEDPRSEPYGKVVQFADPFGNKWDLIAPTP